MIYERDALKRIFDKYDEDRTKARMERDRRVKEVNEKYPQLLEFDRKITEIGIENFKNILKRFI